MANKKSELYTIHLDYGESIMLIFRFLLNCQIVQMRGRLKSVYSVYLKWLDVVVEILKQLVLKRRISIEPNFRLCWHAVDCVLLIQHGNLVLQSNHFNLFDILCYKLLRQCYCWAFSSIICNWNRTWVIQKEACLPIHHAASH